MSHIFIKALQNVTGLLIGIKRYIFFPKHFINFTLSQ